MDLPFELGKYHKYQTKYKWKIYGLIETDEKIEEIYQCYIMSCNCELCGNAFTSSKVRHMDHDHATGKFRNIVCIKCNTRKSDTKFNTIRKKAYKKQSFRTISNSEKYKNTRKKIN